MSNVRRILNGEKHEELVKLSIAQKIAEMHKWDLIAENTEDNFRITLKISKSTKQKAEAFINTTMDLFVEFVSELLNLEVCSIMLADEFTAELTINSARGLDEHIIKGTRIRFGDQIAGWVAMEGKPLLIEDIENDPHFGRRNIPHYSTKSLLSVPLMNNDKVIGVMNMSDKRTNQPFTERDLHIASMISERISFILKRLHTGEFSDDNLKHFISSLDNIIGIEKKFHQKKNLVFDLMHQIMDKLGTSEHEKKTALYISLLYDIGLSVLNDAVLKKRELTTLEVRSVRSHPLTTIDLIRDFEFSEEVKKAIMHHHERYNGGGYPDGIKGEEIPFISRVLAVVDAYCSMIDERPYRKAYTKDEALQDMKKGAGSLYDPRVVAALEEVLKK
jgi:putative methionine-R-sulfoxide reductase with GAF domain